MTSAATYVGQNFLPAASKLHTYSFLSILVTQLGYLGQCSGQKVYIKPSFIYLIR